MADVIPTDFQRLCVALLVSALIGLYRELLEVHKSHQLFTGELTSRTLVQGTMSMSYKNHAVASCSRLCKKHPSTFAKIGIINEVSVGIVLASTLP